MGNGAPGAAKQDWRLVVKQVLHWMDFVAYLVCVALAVRFGPRVTLWYVGLCLSAASALVWLLARWQLGDAFSVRPRARQLVTHGLYARLRHPVYVFGSLAFLGAFLAMHFWPLLIVWLAVVLIELGRVRGEERVLAETFGHEYMEYRSRTWF
ncbi:MAG: isoprenylcysteine carboxylmethyltransferase family protein [Chloroflexales bacterium]|nr:isoprenylcysteine carboxylmethyltransferase family protein [Chloroflexales bacterium]